MKFITKYKNYFLIFIISGILFVSAGVYAATTLASSDVSYDNTTSGGSYTNVKDSIDELYTLTDSKYTDGYNAGVEAGRQSSTPNFQQSTVTVSGSVSNGKLYLTKDVSTLFDHVVGTTNCYGNGYNTGFGGDDRYLVFQKSVLNGTTLYMYWTYNFTSSFSFNKSVNGSCTIVGYND